MNPKFETLIAESTLRARVAELGAAISQDYADGNLLLLCILRGGVVFLADLMRNISLPLTVDFMALSSYASGARASAGTVRITMDASTSITDRDVLIVEDIVDSGHTLKAVLELLAARRPRSLQVCVLLDKTERREVTVPLKYIGFSIPNRFVVGYGLDMDDQYRNLPYIGIVPGD
jgi:hypoxanthine phosphoribosyltransferase